MGSRHQPIEGADSGVYVEKPDVFGFSQLQPHEQEKAVQYWYKSVLDSLVHNDYVPDDMQDEYQSAIKEAERLQTPWFFGEILMSVANEKITALARWEAERSFYTFDSAAIVRLDRE